MSSAAPKDGTHDELPSCRGEEKKENQRMSADGTGKSLGLGSYTLRKSVREEKEGGREREREKGWEEEEREVS